MATEAARPSSAELASLEHAFASDPTGEAYRALAEAYLALGRFMEAMVVCKKGVKAHPSDPAARVLLAQVYAEQGKDKKAVEELKGALELDGDDPGANRLMGNLLLGQGEMEAGMGRLARAARSAPDDPLVREACEKWGVDVAPVHAAPDPEPEPEPVVPEAVASTRAPAPANGASHAPEVPAPPPIVSPPPAAAPSARPVEPSAPPVVPYQASAPAPATPRPAPRRTPPAQQVAPAWNPPPQIADTYEADLDEPVAKPSRKGSFLTTLAILALGSVALVGWGIWYARSAERDKEMAKLLSTAKEQVGHDSYAAYRAASKTIDKCLEMNPDEFGCNAYAAYIDVLRWGEHGEGDVYKQKAEEYLAKAKEEQTQQHSHLIAAEAYYKFFTGDAQGGIDLLAQTVDRPDVMSSMLSGALGTLLMWSGNLDEAYKRLIQAQNLAPGDPRILAALGELMRRRGQEVKAYNYYAQALNFDKNHVDSLLGEAILALDSDRIDDKEAEIPVEKVLAMSNEQVSPKQMAMAHFAKALLLYSKGQDKEGKAEEERALTLQPNNPDIHVMMGRRWFRKDQYDKAAQEIEKAISIEPKRAGFYVELARVLLAQKGKAKEAVAALEKARAALPDNANLLILLGNAHAQAGDRQKALAAYQDAIAKKDGKYPQAQLAIGHMHREAKEWAKADEMLKKAFDEFKAEFDARGQAETVLEMALLAFDQGKDDDGKNLLETAIKTDQSYADSYYWLGRQYASGRHTRSDAKQALEVYLKLAPSGEHADEAQALLKRL